MRFHVFSREDVIFDEVPFFSVCKLMIFNDFYEPTSFKPVTYPRMIVFDDKIETWS